MKKKIATLVLVFVAFYMAAHFWVRYRNRVTDDVTKTTRLFECEANQVQALSITQNVPGNEETLSFTRVDQKLAGAPASAQLASSEWRVSGPVSGEVDATTATAIATMLCELYDPIPMRSQEPTPAGNNRIAKRIRFEFGESRKNFHELQFIGLSQDRMSLIESEGKFYKIPTKLYQVASLEPKSYLNYRVMRMSPDNIQSASFLMDGKEKFTLERDGAEWRVLAQGKMLGKGNEEAGKYVNRISTLRALDIAAVDFSRVDCEAGKHRVRVELAGIGNKKETLYFNGPEKLEGKLSACSTARQSKFLVHPDLLKYFSYSAKKLTIGM